MKKSILIAAMAFFGLTATAQTQGTITQGPNYANRVFYKLSNQAHNAYAQNSWDLAFYRDDNFDGTIRVNDATGTLVYEASNNMADWNNIDIANIANWGEPLYNGVSSWRNEGAFNAGSASAMINTGWGNYNSVDHHVYGAVIFVLEYANGTYKKLKIDEAYFGFTFTYSSWDGSAWSADQTVTIPNSTNPNNMFNYYSLVNNTEVIAEPAKTDWDFVMTKYHIFYMNIMMYAVTGVQHNSNIVVAKNNEPGGSGDTSSLNYVSAINTIGDDWKSYTGGTYVIATDRAHYIKNTTDNSIFRLVFTGFSGGGTGVTTFNYENVTLGTEELPNGVTFGVFPNPSVDKKINIVFESAIANDNKVSVFNITGAKVYETKLASNGFNNSELNLSQLNAGVYILKFESGNQSATKKIVLQ